MLIEEKIARAPAAAMIPADDTAMATATRASIREAEKVKDAAPAANIMVKVTVTPVKRQGEPISERLAREMMTSNKRRMTQERMERSVFRRKWHVLVAILWRDLVDL